MRGPRETLSSFDKPGKEFSRAWKRARTKSSEKSIHDLRVSTRRLIARMELAQAVSGNKEITRVRKRLKRVLKRMGPLRDIQVQLEILARLRVTGVVSGFVRTLKRREDTAIQGIQGDLKRSKMRRLENALKNLHSDFESLHKAPDRAIMRQSVEQALRLRRSEFFKARRRFKPGNDETLHEMRIAVKKLRYVIEAAQPILGDWAKESANTLHSFQQLMGNTRDLEILRTHLEKWAVRRGKKVAVVPVLERLAEKREGMMASITKSSDMLEHIFPIRNPRPAKETTRAVANRRNRTLPPAVETSALGAGPSDSSPER